MTYENNNLSLEQMLLSFMFEPRPNFSYAADTYANSS